MPINPELLKVVQGGAGKTGAASPQHADTATDSGAPVGAPTMAPQAPEGEQMSAMIQISMAMDMIGKSMPAFSDDSKEGEAMMKALESLERAFGEKDDKAKELVPAELRMLMQTLGQRTPEQQAMAGGGPAGAPPMPKAA